MSTSSPTSWPLYLKFVVLGLISFFLWLFNKDYLGPLLLGAVFAVLTFPIFAWLSSKISFRLPKQAKAFSALITIFSLTTLLVIIGNFLIRQIVREIPNFAKDALSFVDSLPDNQLVLNFVDNFGLGKEDLQNFTNQFEFQVKKYITLKPEDVGTFLQDDKFMGRLWTYGRQTVNAVFDFIVYVVVFVLAWYYALLLGPSWLRNIFEILPLTSSEKNSINQDLRDGIRNVIYANLLSGVIHALVCMILMLIFGIPNLFILTTIIFLIGFLPLSPSEISYAIVIIPILFINPVVGIILIPIAELMVLWVNYYLMPKIIASGEEGNPLFILTSILSGIAIFGLPGFIIAPVIMVFIQTLYRIFIRRVRAERGLAVQI
jgi:predicted PurR-regulated permease PerM